MECPLPDKLTRTRYRFVNVGDVKIFCREAGADFSPALLLLHGFPHMYRNLIPTLAHRYHVVAPDLPGFGFTDTPDRTGFPYSFDHLAEVIEATGFQALPAPSLPAWTLVGIDPRCLSVVRVSWAA